MEEISTNRPFHRLIAVMCGIAAVIVMWGSSSSCYTERKANRQFLHVASSYPEIPESWCAKAYPIQQTVKECIVYKSGEIQTVPGPTVFINCDSAVNAAKAKGQTADRVPVRTPVTKQVDTLDRTHATESINTAAIDQAERKETTAREAFIKSETIAVWWRWMAIGLIAYLAVKTIIRLLFSTLNPIISKLP